MTHIAQLISIAPFSLCNGVAAIIILLEPFIQLVPNLLGIVRLIPEFATLVVDQLIHYLRVLLLQLLLWYTAISLTRWPQEVLVELQRVAHLDDHLLVLDDLVVL